MVHRTAWRVLLDVMVLSLILGPLIGQVLTHRAFAGTELLSNAPAGPHFVQVSRCQVIRRPGTYILTKDLSSEGTCFSIDSDRVVLDLGGHTITYAENPRGKERFGIAAIACFDKEVGPGGAAQGEACSSSGVVDDLSISNGAIIQSTHAIPKSHAVRVGQVRSGEDLTIHDVKFQLSVDSSVAVYTAYVGHQRLYRNTVDSSVKGISNRHQIEGVSFKIESGEQLSGGEIFENHFVGGPQGGIFSATANATVHDNDIRQDGYYWNDFAIYAWGNHEQVFRNTIAPKNGRGIEIGGGAVNVNGRNEGARNVAVYNNNVVVTEAPQTRNHPDDPPSCELGGAYGIQFDDNPANSSAYENNVVAIADQCEAVGLKLTDLGSGNESHNNTYVAKRIANSSQIAAAVLTGGANGFRSQNDTFIADTATIAFDWDGGSNLVFRNPALGKGSNPAQNYVTFSFQNGGTPVSNIHVVDAEFRNGASKNSTDMQPIGANEWHLAAEYFVDWTLRLTVNDGAGHPTPGAMVEVYDAKQAQAFRGTTDANGGVETVLTELHVHNTKAGVEKELRTPYLVKISKSGCVPSRPTVVDLTRATTLSVEMSCK